MFDKIDGFLGRVVFRFLGLLASVLTIAAAYAAYQTLLTADGFKAIVAFVMFGGGALISGYTARYCFSPSRTFGEFTQAVESDPQDVGFNKPQKKT